MNHQDLSVESIIKKYQNKIESKSNHHPSTSSNRFLAESHIQNKQKQSYSSSKDQSSVTTPQFQNTTQRKERFRQISQITQKKNESGNQTKRLAEELPFKSNNLNTHQRTQVEILLRKLDQTEDKLAKSERNYAEVWRKYEKTLQKNQALTQEIENIQKKRFDQTFTNQTLSINLDKENQNLKEILLRQEFSLEKVKEKLAEKTEMISKLEILLKEMNEKANEMNSFKSSLKQESERTLDSQQKMKKQLLKFDLIVSQKQKQKKHLLVQLQEIKRANRLQTQQLKKENQKIEEEYKSWLEECKQQKLKVIESYECQIKQNNEIINSNCFKIMSQSKSKEDVNRAEMQILKLIQNIENLSQELTSYKLQLEQVDKAKRQLIYKISNFQNVLVEKNETITYLEAKNHKIVVDLKNQQQRHRQISQKYNELNQEFNLLKNKCVMVFSEAESSQRIANTDQITINHLKKELLICKEQLAKARNCEVQINSKLTETLSTLRANLHQKQKQKEEILKDFYAERLQNVMLKEELSEVKVHLKRQYDLSIDNTKKQLQARILQIEQEKNIKYESESYQEVKAEKEALYLQLRQLQRKYELLASQIVTVDDMISMAAKMQRQQSKIQRV